MKEKKLSYLGDLETKWRFPRSESGLVEGANSFFKIADISTTIHELVLYALAMKRSYQKPVRLNFQFDDIPIEICSELSDLKPHIEACAKFSKTKEFVFDWDVALKALQRKSIKFLSVHDCNTTGLVGADDYENWLNRSWCHFRNGTLKDFYYRSKVNKWAFYEGQARTQSLANLSALRSFFYLSEVQEKSKIKNFFLGISYLQGHFDLSGAELRLGTGFYSRRKFEPLIDKSVPLWASKLRKKYSSGSGTSVFMPCDVLSSSDENTVGLIIISEFYCAIKEGFLNIKIGKNINFSRYNIDDQYKRYRKLAEQNSEKVNNDRLRKNFKALDTIHYSNFSGKAKIQKLGSFNWFIRLNSKVSKTKVYIALKDSILISSGNLPLTQQLNKTEPCEVFIYLRSKKLSDFFSKYFLSLGFDEISMDNYLDFDENDFENAKKVYGSIILKIKQIINLHTKV